MHYAGPSSSTQNPRINFNWSDKRQWSTGSLVGLINQISESLKCPDVSLSFARSEFDCGVRLTHENDWIILVDNLVNPPQSQFNHFKDVEPLFRHMHHHSGHTLVHAWSRANFIKREFLRLKICTEERDRVLQPTHTIGCCWSSLRLDSAHNPDSQR